MKFERAIEITPEQSRYYGRRFGAAIRARREELGLAQEDVALRADMDRRHYQELEHGFSNSRTLTPANPRLFTMIRLAEALEMEIADFMRYIGRALTLPVARERQQVFKRKARCQRSHVAPRLRRVQ